MSSLINITSYRDLFSIVGKNDIPFIGSLAESVNVYQTKRIHKFLSTLNDQGKVFDSQKREKLNHTINSDLGRDLLTNFAYSAINSYSLKVSYVLAIIYSLYSTNEISETDAKYYCSAINGLDDYLIDAFLNLCNLPEQFPSGYLGNDAPYDVVVISKEFIEQHPELNISYSVEELYSIVDELKNRRLFLPDYTFDRATKAEWTLIFGLNSKSKMLVSIFNNSL